MISVMPVNGDAFRAIPVLLAGGERAVAFLIFEELHYFFYFIPVHVSASKNWLSAFAGTN